MKLILICGVVAVLGGVVVCKFVVPSSRSEGVEQAPLSKPRIAYSSPEVGVTSLSEAAAKSEKTPVVNRDDSSLEKTKAAVAEKINLRKSQKIDGTILGMTEILRLSVEQQETIRNLLKEGDVEKSRGGALIKSARDKSEISRLRMEFAKAVLATEEKIKGALSPDQLDSYAVYRAEVKQTEIEESVNKRISSLTQNIVLSSEQKDALFQIFSAAESGFDPIKLMSEGLVPEEVRQQIDDDTQDKLSGIMTQAQFELYQKQTLEQRKADEKMLGGN